MKCKNIIINPVDRWFHFDKPFHNEMPKDVTLHFLKDHKGNDIMCWMGWEVSGGGGNG